MMQRHYIRCSSSYRSRRVQNRITESILNTERSRRFTSEIVESERRWEEINVEEEEEVVRETSFYCNQQDLHTASHEELIAKIQALKAENQKLKTIQQLQAEKPKRSRKSNRKGKKKVSKSRKEVVELEEDEEEKELEEEIEEIEEIEVESDGKEEEDFEEDLIEGLENQEDEEEEWEVEAILDVRFKRPGFVKEYLVKWKDFDETWNSWEPEWNLRNAQKCIDQYVDQE